MNRMRFGAQVVLIAAVLLVLSFSLASCNANSSICYYAYFEDSAYAMIYVPKTNTLYGIQLPLEQILLWGKSSGMDSIPTAMRNYVGMKDLVDHMIVKFSEEANAVCEALSALQSSRPEDSSFSLTADD